MPIADDFSLSSKPQANVKYGVLTIDADEVYHMSDSRQETLQLWEEDHPEDGDVLVEIRSISALKMMIHETPID